jgi:hypothetical protein
VPFFLALKVEALHFADRTFEALEAIREAEGLVERFEERWWFADLHRLRGVFLTAIGAEETQIEVSFCEAIRVARGRSRLHSRHARKHHTQNTAGERKRVNERDVDSDYLTANFFDSSKRPQPSD